MSEKFSWIPIYKEISEKLLDFENKQNELIDCYEDLYGNSLPILVHSDLTVVNQQLLLRNPSFLAYQGIKHESNFPIKVLLAQNFVTGCATAFNRALLELATPIPKEAVMHDW